MQDELTLLLAKQGAVPRGLAFQAARRMGLSEFEWKDPNTGRVGRFHTRMAGEGVRLPRGMKESDLYRDPVQERINRDYYDQTQQIERDYQQRLRDILSESDTRQKRDLMPYTSDMVPFERNQEAVRELDRHMAGLRKYEEDELIQGTVNEEVQKAAEKDRAEMDRLGKEIGFYESLLNMQNYEQAERDADAQLALGQLMNEEAFERSFEGLQDYERAEQQADAQANLARLAPLRQQQALQPVYPEMGLPALPNALRGIFGLIDRLRAYKEPPPPRQEPYFSSGGIANLVKNQRGRS